VSPLDSRYWNSVSEISEYLSEYGIIKQRYFVEISYYIKLMEKLGHKVDQNVHAMTDLFDISCAEIIKDIELTTNHDVKAIEYYIQARDEIEYPQFVHFGLTSADVSSLALTLSIEMCLDLIMGPKIDEIILTLSDIGSKWRSIAMLSHTHGQPATPTTLGKEMFVFYERLSKQITVLKNIKPSTKFGGAVGNLNAHYVAYPEIDWNDFMDKFVGDFGIRRQKYTTQIEHYDTMVSKFDCMNRITGILINLCRDIWTYISMSYFGLSVKGKEVGSSTMPHKVNPIDFENAEGNLMMASSLFSFLSRKLPVSRLQRDLTDSTVSRNIGVVFGHMLVGLKSICRGLGKIRPNKTVIDIDLNNNKIVLAEAVQTILRKDGHQNAYDIIKDITRGTDLNWKNAILRLSLYAFKNNMKIKDDVMDSIRKLQVSEYIGTAAN